MKKQILLMASLLGAVLAQAQTTDPMLTGWWFNTTNHMYNGILTDVEAVYYNSQYVYVKSSGIPNYYLDGQSVNNGSDQDATWRIPRIPQQAANPTGLIGGQAGLMLDGSVFFTPGDARSYNNAGTWNQLAYYFEGNDMDASNGHSTPDKMYHHHFDNLELHNWDSAKHSPIVGYAWDGYPVYGPFGYAHADGTGGIKRIRSGYKTKSYTTRTNGPSVGGQFPIGCYIEDWEYTAGYGDLDEHNGRFCQTPEYPNGTYAYFTTVDENYKPYYPYFTGPTFYGIVDNSNAGPNGGNTVLPGDATPYTPAGTSVAAIAAIESNINLAPVPVIANLTITLKEPREYSLRIYDVKGGLQHTQQIGKTTVIDMSRFSYGVYFVEVADMKAGSGFIKRIVKQ